MSNGAKVCAIVVTYDDRHEFVRRVVARVLDEGADRAVVVYNGNWRPELANSDHRVEEVVLDSNTGSAGGFRAGIEAALRHDSTCFLLLDDDNLLAPGTLGSLLAAHARLGGDPLLALQAYRPAQPWQRIAACSGVQTIGRPNTYGYFHIANERHLLRRHFIATGHPGDGVAPAKADPIAIDVAAYGGLLLMREALLLGELPDPRYFCYYDDLDFGDRLIRRGVRIELCTSAVIHDLETSWHAHQRRVHPMFSPETSETRLYLDLRNSFIFNRRRRTNRAIYLLNGLGFWLGLTYLALFRSANFDTTRRRLSLIRCAILHGKRGEFTPCPP